MATYDQQTLNSPNPVARYAHRKRLSTSMHLAKSITPVGRVLDYGCGAGDFVYELNREKGIDAVGYEPFMEEVKSDDLPIFRDFNDICSSGKFDLITLFETIEHLTQDELDHFLKQSIDLLTENGAILISAPIEIGPALFLKEFNRSIFRNKWPENSIKELILAALFAIPAKRAANVKISHKGFDFRGALGYLESKGLEVSVLRFGPLPIGTWFGNSQVYFSIKQPYKVTKQNG